jgi:hypothetical protein
MGAGVPHYLARPACQRQGKGISITSQLKVFFLHAGKSVAESGGDQNIIPYKQRLNKLA